MSELDLGGQVLSLFDDLMEGVQIIDREWRYAYVNHVAAAHGRRSREDLIGKTMMEVYPGIETTEMFRVLERCMAERSPQQLENRFTYPDGRNGWFALRINPTPGGIIILSVDITDLKSLAEELRHSREDLANTLECMADAVVCADPAGRVTWMNPAATALTGWSASEAKGRTLNELVAFINQESLKPVEHPVDRIIREGLRLGLANSTLLVTRDGTRIPIASSGAPLRDSGGSIRGVVIVLRNMKEEYELTSMLHQSQKMEAVGQLAGGVAHDFNNLLTVISGYCAFVLDELPQDHEFRPEIEEIQRAGGRAAGLTRQLLAFSRKQVLRPEIIDLNQIVSSMNNMLRRLIGEHIDLVTTQEPGLARIKFDPGRVEQIIMNLAVNARDAMPNGGQLSITTGNVFVDSERARTVGGLQPGPHIMLTVSDTGTGMSDETLKHIFEPFFTTKPAGKGTGLGLSTTYGIVKQSGGSIAVSTEPGRGTSFVIYIPASRESVLPAPPPDRRSHRGTETILLVEDDSAVRSLIRTILHRAGYTVLEAASAQAAIDLCARFKADIHLLLTDVVLPDLSGPVLTNHIRKMRPGIHIVMMSGYTDDSLTSYADVQSNVDFIEKPITGNVLLAKLKQVL